MTDRHTFKVIYNCMIDVLQWKKAQTEEEEKNNVKVEKSKNELDMWCSMQWFFIILISLIWFASSVRVLSLNEKYVYIKAS